MKRINAILPILGLTVLLLNSCIEHEVIPPPIPQVELDCYFDGLVNNVPLTLTQNVGGVSGTAAKAQNIMPPPTFSSERYFFTMSSDQTPRSITVGLGSVFWDGATETQPTVSQFNNFHKNTLTPNFSNSALNGFEVKYVDVLGNEWVSDENSTNFQDVTFSNVKLEADASGEYSLFDCTFDCYVYFTDPITSNVDSMRVQGTNLKGWFKR
jgi:hypothetical protein